MAEYVPPGWPTGVHPPGSEEFEQTAVAWLLDVVPPDYRLHGVLRRHPVALAALARHHLAACVAGAREGYRTARAELGDRLPAGSLDAVLDAYRTEGRRLVETARAVDLVGRALRGEVFTPQMAGTQDERRSAAGKRSPERSGAKQQADRPGETPRPSRLTGPARHPRPNKPPTPARHRPPSKPPTPARQHRPSKPPTPARQLRQSSLTAQARLRRPSEAAALERLRRPSSAEPGPFEHRRRPVGQVLQP